MTQTELNKLTLEQKRIAIATACGWVPDTYDEQGYGGKTGKRLPCWVDLGPKGHGDVAYNFKQLPDYLNSLDAMSKAESGLVFSKRQRYYDALREVRAGNDGYLADIELCLSTAAQRADAFLLTMG